MSTTTLQSLERCRSALDLELSKAETIMIRAKSQYQRVSKAFDDACRRLEAARVEQAIMESENVLSMKDFREKRIQEATNAKRA